MFEFHVKCILCIQIQEKLQSTVNGEIVYRSVLTLTEEDFLSGSESDSAISPWYTPRRSSGEILNPEENQPPLLISKDIRIALQRHENAANQFQLGASSAKRSLFESMSENILETNSDLELNSESEDEPAPKRSRGIEHQSPLEPTPNSCTLENTRVCQLNCNICLGALYQKGSVCMPVMLSCEHTYCFECFSKWFTTKKCNFDRIKRKGGFYDPAMFHVQCVTCTQHIEYAKGMPTQVKTLWKGSKEVLHSAVVNTINCPQAPPEIKKEVEFLTHTRSSVSINDLTKINLRAACCYKCKESYVTFKPECQIEVNAKTECFSCQAIKNHPGFKWLDNVVPCDNCGEEDPTYIQRINACSHVKCPRCAFEMCSVCGGEFNRSITFQDTLVKTTPYCAAPDPDKKNKNGGPRKVGLCMCVDRRERERQSKDNLDFSMRLGPTGLNILYDVAGFATL